MTEASLDQNKCIEMQSDFRKAFESFIERGIFKTQMYQFYICEQEEPPEPLIYEIMKLIESSKENTQT